MAIIVLKAWYLETVLTLGQVAHPHPTLKADLRLSKTGLLKSGMRADFLDDVEDVQHSRWFDRYLMGEGVEFYVEGSGIYSISNLDLISRELYFTKRASYRPLQPTCFWLAQHHDPALNQRHQGWIEAALHRINRDHSPVKPLSLITSPEGDYAHVDAALVRQVRESLVVIADVSGVIPGSLPSPSVCLHLGFALHHKRPEQLIVVAASHTQPNLPLDVMGFTSVGTEAAMVDTLLGCCRRLGVVADGGKGEPECREGS